MITIRRTAWHYRFNQWLANRIDIALPESKKSICPYFWYTMYNFIRTLNYFVLSVALWKIPKTFQGPIDDEDLRLLKINTGPFKLVGISLITALIVAVIVAFLMVFVISQITCFGLSLYYWVVPTKILTGPEVLGWIAIFGFIVMGIIDGDIRPQDHIKAPNLNGSLFFEYAKARKNKICPMIKFED